MPEGGRGNCLKYFKSGWNRKEGRGKWGAKLGQGVGALKREGGWNPLTNYACLGIKLPKKIERKKA